MSNPASPENNRHHTEAYQSEEEWWESEFGKGPFDPDFMEFYPGEQEATDVN